METADMASLICTESILSLAAVALFALGMWRLTLTVYVLAFQPLDYCGDSAHLHERAATKRGLVTRNWLNGSPADAKPRAPFPNGWFFVDQSTAFRRGQVRHVSMLGLDLAVFRDESGEMHALDAFCPHLGANMAVGGRVVGSCIECPFHGWQFKGSDGVCQHIPGAKRVPKAANTRTWRLLERNAAVLLWYHAEDREPYWMPPELDDYANNGYRQFCGRTKHIVYSHIQDIPENGADYGHFDVVHKMSSTFGSDLRRLNTKWSYVGWHSWSVISPWRPLDDPDGHVATVTVGQGILIGDRQVPFVGSYEVEVTQMGPGIVYLKLFCKALSHQLLFFQYVVPEEPLKQRVTHLIYSRPGLINRVFAKLILSQESNMFERDVQIWNNKCYRSKPVLASSAGDESLLRFRRWFSQFYSPLPDVQAKPVADEERCLDW